MILDELSEFADATALSTAGTGLANVGDVIDTGDGYLTDVDNLFLVIDVTTAITSAGSATVDFRLVSDSTATPAVDGSATVHWSSGEIPKATLVAGHRVVAVELPKGTYERYLGVQADIGTGALTAGAINAYLTPRPQTWRAFPE